MADMPTEPDQTTLDAALVQACEFDAAHDVDITPGDFDIRSRGPGLMNATCEVVEPREFVDVYLPGDDPRFTPADVHEATRHG